MEKTLRCLHDAAEISALLRETPGRHLYSIGDLDPDFWSDTTWYGLSSQDHLEEIFLLYSGLATPTLIAMQSSGRESAAKLLNLLSPLLPRELYAHVSPGLEAELSSWQLRPRGLFHRMILHSQAELTHDLLERELTDPAELEAFLDLAYPGHYFSSPMLRAGPYIGIYERTELLAVAGCHVYSLAQSCAALGNIAVAPRARGRGLGKLVTSRLCSLLQKRGVRLIGLNVSVTNSAAVSCYQGAGFTPVADFIELHLRGK